VRSKKFSKLSRSSILVGAALASLLATAVNVQAQALKDVQTPDAPLVLKAQGSFFVGGEKVEQTQGELGDLGPGGHITVNQMYVRYIAVHPRQASPSTRPRDLAIRTGGSCIWVRVIRSQASNATAAA
jgi:hypothetical protein